MKQRFQDFRQEFETVRRLAWEAASVPTDPDLIERDNSELLTHISPPVDRLMRWYFRLDVEGIEHVPRGKAMLVSNHEAGVSFLPVVGMGARWVMTRGTEERVVPLMHDAMFRVPYVGNLLAQFGAVRATPDNALAVLNRGHKLYVCPGGNLEAFRPFKERYRIKFGGHRGWARIALRSQTPVVPIVFIGGHETFFVLHDGRDLVRRLGLKRFMRVDTFPIFLGLPWGIGVGPMFHVPLPAKCKVRFLEPIEPPTLAPGNDDDDDKLAELYERVTSTMQHTLTEMSRRRRFLVMG